MQSCSPAVTFRPATVVDCSDLAILSDAATRRLSSFLWASSATTGQSPFEVGRSFIRTQADHFTHYAKWQVAEIEGSTVAALNCCLLPIVVGDRYLADSPEVTRNLNELKVIAGGTWYITAAAVFPEYRNRGIGEALLSKAEALAREQNNSDLTLMVGSFNEGALRLYRRFGFSEWGRRVFTPFFRTLISMALGFSCASGFSSEHIQADQSDSAPDDTSPLLSIAHSHICHEN